MKHYEFLPPDIEVLEKIFRREKQIEGIRVHYDSHVFAIYKTKNQKQYDTFCIVTNDGNGIELELEEAFTTAKKFIEIVEELRKSLVHNISCKIDKRIQELTAPDAVERKDGE